MDDRHRMDHRAPWIPWAITSLALVLVAVVAYSLGAGREAVAPAGEPVRRIWLGGFPVFWLLFPLFWMLFGGLRWMLWGGYPHRPWRYRRYDYHPYDDERDAWEEWHRRAHDRMDSSNARGASTPSRADQRPIT